MTEAFTVVIPARYASTRLPGKPLADLCGRPMIAWVVDCARASGAAEVIVATDDARIADAARTAGARVEMTSEDHASGTDRIAEVATRLDWPDEHIVVNLQGDEPLMPPALITQAAGLLAGRPAAAIATLMTPVESDEALHDPSTAKVIFDRTGRALYFSRAPIPWSRDGERPEPPRRHIGLYAYRVRDLRALSAEPPCELEIAERLEQLRALWMGLTIVVADAMAAPGRGVDTQDDLEAVRNALMQRGFDAARGR